MLRVTISMGFVGLSPLFTYSWDIHKIVARDAKIVQAVLTLRCLTFHLWKSHILHRLQCIWRLLQKATGRKRLPKNKLQLVLLIIILLSLFSVIIIWLISHCKVLISTCLTMFLNKNLLTRAKLGHASGYNLKESALLCLTLVIII